MGAGAGGCPGEGVFALSALRTAPQPAMLFQRLSHTMLADGRSL